jgi:hypothetical protein
LPWKYATMFLCALRKATKPRWSGSGDWLTFESKA